MKITLSKKQWQFIGRKTGWIKSAQTTKDKTKYVISWTDKNLEFLKVKSPNSVIKTRDEAYENITNKQHQEWMNQVSIKVVSSKNTDPDRELIKNTYDSEHVAHFGFSDWEDHSKDDSAKLQKILVKSMGKSRNQLGLYLNDDGTWIQDVVGFGYWGGISGKALSKLSFFSRWRD